MNKIINGKKYDTETAKLAGVYSFAKRTSPSFYEEKLFLKKTGEWFLYGSGESESKYSDLWDGDLLGIEKIIPYTEHEAKRWAERHMDVDEYETLFGKVEE